MTDPFHGRLLLSAAEVAHVLSLGKRTIWSLLSRGTFPKPVRVGRRRLWRTSEISRWVEEAGTAEQRSAGRRRAGR